MSSLTGLPEIGPVLARHLIAIGITDADQLRQAGAEEAFLRIRADLDPDACSHELMALKAAIQGIRTTALDPTSWVMHEPCSRAHERQFHPCRHHRTWLGDPNLECTDPWLLRDPVEARRRASARRRPRRPGAWAYSP
ncbi:MAG: TfoX/Sxy family protein [Propionibacteriaceae bacterium]|nr:TfoX/Sxy family protein [Propionibacteriaceae bacterium]